MSTTITGTFETPADYTYDSSLIEISGGSAYLKLREASGTYTEDFADDTGFVYESANAEFTGGLIRQKNQTPSGSVFGATYTSSINASWSSGSGTLTGTVIGSPAITSNKLICTPLGVNGVSYNNTELGTIGDTGCLRIKYTPNYNNTPANNVTIFELYEGTEANKNIIVLGHSGSNGRIKLAMGNSGNTLTHNIEVSLSAWQPTSGTTYEFEINFTCSTGDVKLFIDGTLFGSVPTTAFTRTATATKLIIGGGSAAWYPYANGSYEDFIAFSSVQHTGNYTKGYAVPETLYYATYATLPEFEHTQTGSILDVTSFTTTEAGSPKYTIQINRSGNFLYHTGSAWATSNGTYAQSNTSTDLATLLLSLAIDSKYVQIKALFQGSNTLSTVSNLSIVVNENINYPTTSPSIVPNATFYATKLEYFLATYPYTGGDGVRFCIRKSGTDYYWTGSAVAVSDGSYAQANTEADILANIGEFLTTRSLVGLKILLYSSSGATTPTVDDYSIIYNSALSNPTLPTLVNVEGFIYDANGAVSSQELKIRPYLQGYFNKGIFHKYAWETIGTTDVNGFFSSYVYLQGTLKFWELKIGAQSYKIALTDTAEMDLKDCTTFEAIND